MPFALKLYESLLESVPKNQDLLIATCSALHAVRLRVRRDRRDVLGEAHHDEVDGAARPRAEAVHARARTTACARWRCASRASRRSCSPDPAAALTKAEEERRRRCSTGPRRPGARRSRSASTSPISSSIFRRCARWPNARSRSTTTWSNGAIHEMMITLDSLPEALGGSVARAREHFAQAVEIQKGLSPGPYVALAMGVSVPAQDKAEFTKLAQRGARDRSREEPEHAAGDAHHAAPRARAARPDRHDVREISSHGGARMSAPESSRCCSLWSWLRPPGCSRRPSRSSSPRRRRPTRRGTRRCSTWARRGTRARPAA